MLKFFNTIDSLLHKIKNIIVEFKKPTNTLKIKQKKLTFLFKAQ